MKKTWAAALAAAILCLCLSAAGCSDSSQAMSGREFGSAMEQKGYTVTQETEPEDTENCQQMVCARDGQKVLCTYYCMEDCSSAARIYEQQVEILRNRYNDSGAYFTEMNSEGNDRYTVQGRDHCYAVVRCSNGVLIIKAGPRYSQEVRSLIRVLAS